MINREDLTGHRQTLIHDFAFRTHFEMVGVPPECVVSRGPSKGPRFRAAPNGIKRGVAPGALRVLTK